MAKTKKNTKKNTKKRALTHPSDLIIPIKNVFYDAPLMLFKLFGEPLLLVGLDISEKVGKKTAENLLTNSKLLAYDAVWGTDRLHNRLLGSHGQGHRHRRVSGKAGKKKGKKTRKKGGGRRRR